MTAAMEKGHTTLMGVSVLHVADLQGYPSDLSPLASSASGPMGGTQLLEGPTLKGQ